MRGFFKPKQPNGYVVSEVSPISQSSKSQNSTKVASPMESRQNLNEQSPLLIFKTMTNQIIRQNVGIDVSKATITVAIAQKKLDQSVVIKSTKTFSNNLAVFAKMDNWVKQFTDTQIAIHYNMEATGVYYEALAYWLYERQRPTSVILAKQFKNYAASLNIKSKTDDIDARVLAQMGVERVLSFWQPHSFQMRTLKQLSRERNALKDEQTDIKNQLHALNHSYRPDENNPKRVEKRLELIKQQIKEIEQDMKNILEKDPELKQRIDNVCTIKGVGLITAISIISEANGFALFRSKAQLVCYAGYNVVNKDSGTSVKSKPRISKKGNKNIRKSLHFPSLTAIQYDSKMQKTYDLIYDKTKIKMKGVVAIQRKILVLIYTIFKKNEAFDENYFQKTA